jgi:hypothetical protein
MLLKRTVVAGKAYAAMDADNPRGGALAVALLGPDGWKVGTAAGVIAARLDQRRALALMMRAANHIANTKALRALLAGGAR